MKILITGGAGYIGSVLTPYLLSLGHKVTVLDNFLFRQVTLMDCCSHPDFSIVRGDVRDKETMKSLMKDCDAILPLASLVGAPMCSLDKLGAQSINLDAIQLMMNLRSRDQLIIYPNTNSGYGVGLPNQPCTEETPFNPLSLYGVTKTEAENMVLDAGDTITFRLATVFGMSPRPRLDLLVNDFVYRAVHDRFVVVFEGHFKRNYLHVRDASRVFAHALDNYDLMKGSAYNVGLDDANFSKLELCSKIKTHLPDFVYSEATVGQDPDKRDYIVSNVKISKTGFRTSFSLDDGIKELIKGYVIVKNSGFGNV